MNEPTSLTAVIQQSQVTKALRQVLQNELGLTREAVMQMAAGIIDSAVKLAVERTLAPDKLGPIIARHVSAYMKSKANAYIGNTTDHLTELARNAIKEELRKAVYERVRIEVLPASSPQTTETTELTDRGPLPSVR